MVQGSRYNEVPLYQQYSTLQQIDNCEPETQTITWSIVL